MRAIELTRRLTLKDEYRLMRKGRNLMIMNENNGMSMQKGEYMRNGAMVANGCTTQTFAEA